MTTCRNAAVFLSALLTGLTLAVYAGGSADPAVEAAGRERPVAPTAPADWRAELVAAVRPPAKTPQPSDGAATADRPAEAPAGARKPSLGDGFHPDLLPRRDYVLIRFDRPLDQLRSRRKPRFGVFREVESREVQWIDVALTRVALPPNGEVVNALNLHYEVPAAGSSNGWWMKLMGEDWHPYRNWDVVLRLRLGDPSTRTFKLELKTRASEVHAAIVRITDAHLRGMECSGFFDVAIPVREILGAAADLSRMHELVLVFENARVDNPKGGDLLIHSIRLAPDASDQANLSPSALLDDLARRAFLWFRDNRDGTTGLILDRSPNAPVVKKRPTLCSIAAVGYYLSMLPEAIRTGQMARPEAEKQALQVLAFVLEKMDRHSGLLFHFCDARTGEPSGGSEVSLLDSAIFFNGCMVAAQFFGGRIAELSDALLDRADWPAFVITKPGTGKRLLALGWSSRKGLLGPMDVRSSEMAMPYFLAIGSRTHPVDRRLWFNTHVKSGDVCGHKVLNPTHPLFTSYHSLGWHRLKGLVDRERVDLEANAREAALANRDYCRGLADQFRTYHRSNGGWWGISAGDSPRGYVAPGPIRSDANGTVWPMAALATCVWLPEVVKEDLGRWHKSRLWGLVCGPYGLSPFNLDQRWVAPDLLAIDLGSLYLSVANYRNNTIRDLWMNHPVAKAALQKLGYARTRKSSARDTVRARQVVHRRWCCVNTNAQGTDPLGMPILN